MTVTKPLNVDADIPIPAKTGIDNIYIIENICMVSRINLVLFCIYIFQE